MKKHFQIIRIIQYYYQLVKYNFVMKIYFQIHEKIIFSQFNCSNSISFENNEEIMIFFRNIMRRNWYFMYE